MTLMRTIIDLPEHLVKSLDSIRSQEKKSRAAIIREALNHYLSERLPMGEEAFGLWQDAPIDGLAFQEKMRDEWSGS